MNAFIINLGLLQVALPFALIMANTLIPSGSRLGLALRSIALLLLLVFDALAGLWLFPPWWTPYLLIGLLIIGTLLRAQWTPSRRSDGRGWLIMGEGILGMIAVIGAIVLLIPVFQGRAAPAGAVDLAMPLGPGTFLVTSGGTTNPINAHLFTLNLERTRAFRGQSYAVDIIGIDPLGLRATGISPTNPADYVIYGTPVLAPCDGAVALVTDGVADMPVPQMDRDNMTGNSIMLDCGGNFVLLAHLAPGSISVQQGQTVVVGQQIGQVGNSGNTGEPHLHVHVQNALPTENPISADPVWFTINGRFLVRNDTFEVGN